MCGGTFHLRKVVPASAGLSPRVRGNPLYAPRIFSQVRSIPACAGEPPSFDRKHCSYTVYPRVCGGTRLDLEAPRQRSVYPRVCGGTPNRS